MPGKSSKSKAAGPAPAPDPAPSLGQVAYEAYVEAGMQDAGFSSVSGARLPAWPDQEGRIQARWEAAAAAAVAAHVRADPPVKAQ